VLIAEIAGATLSQNLNWQAYADARCASADGGIVMSSNTIKPPDQPGKRPMTEAEHKKEYKRRQAARRRASKKSRQEAQKGVK
jgi:hypothetical protein